MSDVVDPVTTFVRELDGDYYMMREAAAELGLAYSTLRTLNQKDNETLGASYMVYFGKVPIYLYTKDDIERIRKALDDRKIVIPADVKRVEHERVKPMGRPPVYTPEQRKARQKLYSKRHYYNKCAQIALDNGQIKKSQNYLKRAKEIKMRLDKDQV